MFPLPFVPLSNPSITLFPIMGTRMVGKQSIGEEMEAGVQMYPILVKEAAEHISVLIRIETPLIPPLDIVLEWKPL
jgi:hypothetical protein